MNQFKSFIILTLSTVGGALAILLITGVASFAQAEIVKEDAPRDAYMCVTAYQVTIELLEGKPELQAWSKEMKQKLLDKYNFKQTRLDITYQNFGTDYALMRQWQDGVCAFPSKI